MSDAHHDSGYKYLFSHAELVRELLDTFAPPGVAAQLDYATLRRENGHYVTPALKQREQDVVWSVRLADQRIYLYILLECQSRSDPHMPVRMLQYVAALYDHLLRSDTMDIRDGLPPVLPIVLYNGDARWTHPAELAPLIQPHPPALAPFQPSLRFWLLDQGVWLDARWRGVMAAIFRFEHTRDVDSAKRAIRELAEQIARSPARRVLDRVLMRWVQHRLTRKLPGIDAIQHHHLIESMDMLETNIDRWKEQALAEGREQGMLLGMQQGMQQGIQQGMASGIEQGRQQGLAQGERQLLQRLLDRRFGPLPDWALARLAHADAAQLEAWSEAVLDAAALSEVLGAPPH